MSKVSRRVFTAMAAAAAQTKAAEYSGPLTETAGKAAGRGLDPLPYAIKLLDAAPRQLRFTARNKAEATEWQRRLRAKLIELMGGFPSSPVALKPLLLESREFPQYKREQVILDTRKGVSALAYVITPKGAKGPLPTVICVPGHGRGVDDIIGIDDHGRARTDKGGYQHDFALQVVEAGMAAVAIEPMGFGCRRDPANIKRGLGRSSCQPVAGTALLVGQTLIGWRVYDIMRTVDFIQSRPELDAKRIGCVGISGGGTCTLFATAVEPRISAAMVSGYMNTFRDSIGSIAHCMDNYVPGILNWAEMYDIAGLIAPRPLFVESGRKDDIFPVDASIESFRQVSGMYKVFGASNRVEQEVFDEAHSFWGKRGVPFLARHLGA